MNGLAKRYSDFISEILLDLSTSGAWKPSEAQAERWNALQEELLAPITTSPAPTEEVQ